MRRSGCRTREVSSRVESFTRCVGLAHSLDKLVVPRVASKRIEQWTDGEIKQHVRPFLISSLQPLKCSIEVTKMYVRSREKTRRNVLVPRDLGQFVHQLKAILHVPRNPVDHRKVTEQ